MVIWAASAGRARSRGRRMSRALRITGSDLRRVRGSAKLPVATCSAAMARPAGRRGTERTRGAGCQRSGAAPTVEARTSKEGGAAPMDERRDRPRRGWTRNHGWLETPDGHTVADRAGAVMDRAAERISPSRHPRWWDAYTFGTTAPARPPGYDTGIPAIYMLTAMLFFFWVPILNAFIGGCLGGWRARSLRRALGAVGLTV